MEDKRTIWLDAKAFWTRQPLVTSPPPLSSQETFTILVSKLRRRAGYPLSNASTSVLEAYPLLLPLSRRREKFEERNCRFLTLWWKSLFLRSPKGERFLCCSSFVVAATGSAAAAVVAVEAGTSADESSEDPPSTTTSC